MKAERRFEATSAIVSTLVPGLPMPPADVAAPPEPTAQRMA
jgi:hypothetical protein